MYSQSAFISDLRLHNKILERKVAEFESGERYTRMQKEHREDLAYQSGIIRGLKKELADTRRQVVDVRNKWIQTCEDVTKECEKKLVRMEKALKKAEARALEAERQRDNALDRLHERTQELYEVKGQVEDAQEKIQALQAVLHKDHTNSSKSSSTNPNHKTIHNSREKSGRKPGGQPGHKHYPRKPRQATETIPIQPPSEFLNSSRYKATGNTLSRQVIKLHVVTEVIEYTTPEFLDMKTGKTVHAEFPEDVTNDVNYDGTVKAAAYILKDECYVSIGKTKQFLGSISRGKVDLSAGMICNLSREFSEKTKPERDKIFLDLMAAPVVNTDFTFGRKNGRQATVLVTATPEQVLYQARPRKGEEGVKGTPVENYDGTVVSDHESVLCNKGSRHQECMAHIERYLRSSIENEPGLKWNQLMLKWVQTAIHYWKSLNGQKPESNVYTEHLLSEYDKIMDIAKAEYEYEPPGKYFKEGYNTYKRMHETKADYVLFLIDPTVPPTNNLAERCGRRFKRKAHQVMTFRSDKGAEWFCDGLSVTQTLKAKEENLFQAIADRFNQRK